MILGTSGRPMVELGGTNALKQFTKGDIVCSLQWLDLGNEDGPEPCAALFPAVRRMDTGAFVVPQAKAFEYFTRDGHPTGQLMGAAFKAAIQMGFHPDKSTVHRVIDVLTDAAPDLVRMPSSLPASVQEAIRKEGERNVMGIEATASVNGKVVVEKVI
jgi:hypothetical protein